MIEPFRIDVAQVARDDLHVRLARTRWPADFANDDWRNGANAAFVRDLASAPLTKTGLNWWSLTH